MYTIYIYIYVLASIRWCSLARAGVAGALEASALTKVVC